LRKENDLFFVGLSQIKVIFAEFSIIIRPSISDGFVGGRSTSLVEFLNIVLIEMKDGRQVDVVYTDFSKA
jgi:hypothetical protein